jgi:hypothetical protein
MTRILSNKPTNFGHNYRIIYTIDDEIIVVEGVRVDKRDAKTDVGLG